MEAVLFAFALGAGAVVAVKHGRRALTRAVGWTAEKTGYISGRVKETLAEAKQVARDRYEVGRDTDGRTELPPPSSRAPQSPPPQPAPGGNGNGTRGTGAIGRP
jgi:hypothetical protein